MDSRSISDCSQRYGRLPHYSTSPLNQDITKMSNQTDTAGNATTDVPSSAPTYPPSPTACEGVKPGDINFWIVTSGKDSAVAMFPLTNIPGTVGSLFLTDAPWNGTQFLDREGILEVRIFCNFYLTDFQCATHICGCFL